jgi:Glycosyl hydrolases family 31 TIM-barrel domain
MTVNAEETTARAPAAASGPNVRYTGTAKAQLISTIGRPGCRRLEMSALVIMVATRMPSTLCRARSSISRCSVPPDSAGCARLRQWRDQRRPPARIDHDRRSLVGRLRRLDIRPSRFPRPAEMTRQLHEMGFSIMLWLVPFLSPDSENSRMAARKGWLITGPDGPSFASGGTATALSST